MIVEEQLIKYSVTKHLILLKIQNMMDIKEVFLQWFINVLIKNLLVKNVNTSIKELAEELQKPIIRNFEKRTVQSSFIDKI